MQYRIGDVSKILNLSDQMIRYYEKHGVIHPRRSGDGQYRYYTEMDIFLLFEAMKYKEWDISIPEINDLISNDYYQKLIGNLDAYEKKLSSEIEYKSIMKQRVASVKRKLQLSRYNRSEICVDILPACELYYMGKSYGDEYDMSQMDPRMSSVIYSPEYISFFDPYAEYEGENGTWWYIIRSDFAEALKLPVYGKHKHLDEQAVLTTFIDMGEPGEFTSEKYRPLLAYAEEKHYETAGGVSGFIVGRGNEESRFRRMMQIMIPIRSL